MNLRCAGSLILAFLLFPPTALAQGPRIWSRIKTVAGPALPLDGAPANTQDIGEPTAIISDRAGGYYVASGTKHSVFHVNASGAIRIIAGSRAFEGYSGDGGPATEARLNIPEGLALDSIGNLFIADKGNFRIRKVTPEGIISTVAGVGFTGRSTLTDGVPAVSTQIGQPYSVAVDQAGNLFFGAGSRIRRVDTQGIITTIAGREPSGFSGDGGPAALASMGVARSMVVDAAGNLFFADSTNFRVRKIDTAGIISTVAGSSPAGFAGDGGPATEASLSFVWGISVDQAGNLFLVDYSNRRIRRVDTRGVITTIAGTGQNGFFGDGGSATSARIYEPQGLAADGQGNLLIADTRNYRVRQISSTRIISTVAGIAPGAFQPGLSFPAGVAVHSNGDTIVADTRNRRILKITPDGTVALLVTTLDSPNHVAIDSIGNVFFTAGDLVRKISTQGVVTTIAGGIRGYSGDGGLATSARLNTPIGIAVDRDGNVFIADYNNKRVRRVTPAGLITTVAGGGSSVAETGVATEARIDPVGLSLDSAGNLFVSDHYNRNRIRKVTPDGAITTVAGSGGEGFSGDGGPATSAELRGTLGVAVDAWGNIFISDSYNHRVRKVSTDGIITTIAGSGVQAFGGDGEAASTALLDTPHQLAVDAKGDVYVADWGNSSIRKIEHLQRETYHSSGHGISFESSGTSSSEQPFTGHARVESGGATTAGLAIFGFRQNDILITEAGIAASPLIAAGRIFVEMNGPVRTGIAFANPHERPVTISFYFTDDTGNYGIAMTTVPAWGHFSAFLDQPPFNKRSAMTGTFTFSSSLPVSAGALRGLTNERGEFLITSLPVADLSEGAPQVFPHFAAGGGWTTQVALINRADIVVSGVLEFLDDAGSPLSVQVGKEVRSQFSYSIPARGAFTLNAVGTSDSILTGSMRLIAAGNALVPSGVLIFTFKKDDVTVAAAGVPASSTAQAFTLYAESNGGVQSGIAIANYSTETAFVNLELRPLDGSGAPQTATLSVAPSGHVAAFLNQFEEFQSAALPARGVLRVTSSTPISITGLRGRYNERGDFLVTTTPAIPDAALSGDPLYFPHIVDGAGYTTQFILLGPPGSEGVGGALYLFSPVGAPLNLTFTGELER